MFRRGFLKVLLAAVLVLGIATAAYADPGKGKGNWKFNGKNKKQFVQLNDISSHWAEQPVRYMCSYGIITGYPDFTFRPNVPVTKYEAIMMISRAAGFDGSTGSVRNWDGNVPEWMEDCLDYAVSEGILTEEEADELKGFEPAKRYEVAVWAARAAGLEGYGDVSFSDSGDIPFYALSYVGGMFKNRYMIGYSGNFFQPNKPVTRAELAVVLYRIIQDRWADEDGGGDQTDALEIYSLSPADGSADADPSTDELVVKFNVEIKALDDIDAVKAGIGVMNVTDDEDVDVDEVLISGRTLTIRLEDALESGKTYRVTIEDDIIEAEESGENFEGISGIDWEFSTEGALEIVSLLPADGDDDVDGPETSVLEAEFSGDIQVVDGRTLLGAVRVYNVSDGEEVDVDKVEIDGDTLVITLEDPLESGDTFEVTIRAGYFEDEDTGAVFEGVYGSDWRFTTKD
ncbi:MAG TPA: Ig-like domain-containing protein [Bacillota bacterium]|nr:Ig-like domain-containing protein [Bacillota bacterium]